MHLTVEDAARSWFKETFTDEFYNGCIKYKDYVCDVPEIGCEMYYDLVGEYYFLIRKGNLSECSVKGRYRRHHRTPLYESGWT